MHDVILAILINSIWFLYKIKHTAIIHCKQVVIEQPELKSYSVTNSASFLTLTTILNWSNASKYLYEKVKYNTGLQL
jgi:hypothetical protein